jgi:hypothetical protein
MYKVDSVSPHPKKCKKRRRRRRKEEVVVT